MADLGMAIINIADLRMADLGTGSPGEEDSLHPWIDQLGTVSHKNLPPTSV